MEPHRQRAESRRFATIISNRSLRLLASKAPQPLKPKKLSVELDPDFYNAAVARAKADGITLPT